MCVFVSMCTMCVRIPTEARCLCLYVYYVCEGSHRGQRTLDILDLEFQVVVNYLMWVLGTATGSLARAVGALNC